jgi:hypothetical protein
MPWRRQLRRIWVRAGFSCALYLLLALAFPRIHRALDPQSERRTISQAVERTQREAAPVYVMPNGERRRAVAVTVADSTDTFGDRALYIWCGALALVTIAGAAVRTIRLYLTRDEIES